MEISLFIIVLFLIIAAGVIAVIQWRGRSLTSDLFLERIKILLKDKKFDEAVDLGLKYLQKHSSSFTLMQYIADAYEGLYQYRHAIEYNEKSLVLLAKDANSFRKQDIRNKLGELYTRIDDIDRALGYYNIVLDENPHNMKALFLSSRIMYTLKHYQKAMERIERFLTFRPNETPALLLLAHVYYEIGEYQKSILILDRLLKSDEEIVAARNDEVFLLLAKTHFAMKNYSRVLPYVKNVMNNRQFTDEAIPLLIIALIKDKKINAALIEYHENITLIPEEKRGEVMYQVAQALLEEGEIFLALETWQKVFEKNPNYLDVREVMKKYGFLLDNPGLRIYFSTDMNEFQDFILKKFHTSLNSIVERRRDFWVLKDGNEAIVLYRKIDQISAEMLSRMEDTLKANSVYGFRTTIYSLFGTDQNSRSYNFYKGSKEVSDTDFVKIFTAEAENEPKSGG